MCTQGHNQLVAYGRAAYFCIFCALIWLLELLLLRSKDLPVSTLYGVTIVCHDTLLLVRDVLVGRPEHTRMHALSEINLQTTPFFASTRWAGFTFCFPVAFLVGLFPQINTFTIYLLEQIDMHLLGGTGSHDDALQPCH